MRPRGPSPPSSDACAGSPHTTRPLGNSNDPPASTTATPAFPCARGRFTAADFRFEGAGFAVGVVPRVRGAAARVAVAAAVVVTAPRLRGAGDCRRCTAPGPFVAVHLPRAATLPVRRAIPFLATGVFTLGGRFTGVCAGAVAFFGASMARGLRTAFFGAAFGLDADCQPFAILFGACEL